MQRSHNFGAERAVGAAAAAQAGAIHRAATSAAAPAWAHASSCALVLPPQPTAWRGSGRHGVIRESRSGKQGKRRASEE